MKVLHFIKKYIRKNWWLWLPGLLLPAVFSTASNIYFAGRLQSYVALLTEHRGTSMQSVAGLLLPAIPVLLILSWVDELGLCLFSLFQACTEGELRSEFCRSLMGTSLKNLQKLSQGELITRYTTDAERSSQIVSWDIFGVIYPLLVGAGYMTAVLLASRGVAAVMLALGVSVILLNFLFVPRMKRVQEAVLQGREACTSNFGNAIHGKMSIRQYAAGETVSEQIREAARQLYQRECGAVRLEALKILTSDALANGCTYLLTPLACMLAVRGCISVSLVLFIHQLCRCFIMYTQNFAVAFLHYNEHKLSFERLHTVLLFPEEGAERGKDGAKDFPENGAVSFENVCVSYGGHQVLEDISFTAFPGECVGIAGESGSGKSTLVKALMQMVDYQGKICVGGKNCREISTAVLREHIAFVPEHSDVFRTSVYENIAFGNLNASEKEIYCAADEAAIPNPKAFLHRDVGERGEFLSGGQRQRVALARALLKNAPIVILDEPTAALDSDSEAVILHTIAGLKREGKCILLITHRESTLQAADRVVFMRAPVPESI